MGPGTLAGRIGAALVLVGFSVALAASQVPAPFPKPNQPQKPAEPPVKAPTAPPVQPSPPPAAPGTQAPAAAPRPGTPTETMLGVPIYPGSEFLGSFDAGQGQRYYLFGTNTPFADIVTYYKTVLREKGQLVFDEPATHMFEVGRFREDTMAFPPGVTVKDYTWNGSEGYLFVAGAKGTRFRTVIQIVPVPVGATR